MNSIRLHIFAFILLLGVVGCSDYDSPMEENIPLQSTNISIAELQRLTHSGGRQIEQELVIGGYVTSSDDAGNFYRTFTIEDNTGGTEIMAGLYELHNLYPMGHYIIVKLKGCYVAHYNGVMQVGLAPKSYSNYPTDYFSARTILDKHIICYDITKPMQPSPQTISSLKEEMCGRLITIHGLELCSAQHSDLWQVNVEGTWSGYNFFRDAQGQQIVVHTSDYADFSDHATPQQQVAITGILHRAKIGGEEYYIIKMRDEKDCQILQ